MKQRCLNPNNQAYSYYGGRGITVCQEWIDSFACFIRDVGLRPTPKHTIDRYPDKNGNYEPNNVRWATRKEQVDNRRHPTSITFNGETRSIAEWAQHLGLSYQVLYGRLERHPLEEVLSGRLKIVSMIVGEDSHHARLSEAQVREIRTTYATGQSSFGKLAKQFNLSISGIAKIVHRQTWKHVE